MVLVSIKSDAEIAEPRFPPVAHLPALRRGHPTEAHAGHAFSAAVAQQHAPVARTAILTLGVSTTCAYAIKPSSCSRPQTIFRASLFTYMVPSSFIVIPFYGLMVKYGLVTRTCPSSWQRLPSPPVLASGL